MPANNIKIFYSYSHKDGKLRDRLESHLALLKREGLISQWHDRQIGAGIDWGSEIHNQLNDAQIILLLISADFLASDYCYDIEMKRAMELHESGGSRVIPIILRPCDWQGAPFAKVNVLPTDGRPVIHWRDQDTAFNDVARGIRDAISSLHIRGLEAELERWKRVLVVDDEQVISNTLAIILTQAGFKAQAVYSGEKCMEAVAEIEPAFVISDVIMPGMTGVDAAVQIRQRFPNCKVILFTGYAASVKLLEEARAQGHGEFEIYAKPWPALDILRRLGQDLPPYIKKSFRLPLEM